MFLVSISYSFQNFSDTLYVDPAASGDGSGDSWTNAKTTLQSAVDLCEADTLILARGTETISTAVAFDTKNGSSSSMIVVRGCNAAGEVDGTMYVLDANSTSDNCINLTTSNYYYIENVECRDAVSHGVDGDDGGDYWVWINCKFNSNGGDGHRGGASAVEHRFFYCVADSNGSEGFYAHGGPTIYSGCVARYNSAEGFDNGNSYVTFYGCVAHKNGIANFSLGSRSAIINCVADSSTNSINIGGGRCVAIGVRGTYAANGIDGNGEIFFVDNSVFADNTADTLEVGTMYEIQNGGESTNMFGQSSGYIDRNNDDFNLDAGAALRRRPITIGE